MSQAVTLPDVFQYQDYRKYLREVLQARQKLSPEYTIAQFSRAIGFSSHAGLGMVLSGKRELRPPYIDKCSKNLKLSLRQQLYLEAMIRIARQLTATGAMRF